MEIESWKKAGFPYISTKKLTESQYNDFIAFILSLDLQQSGFWHCNSIYFKGTHNIRDVCCLCFVLCGLISWQRKASTTERTIDTSSNVKARVENRVRVIGCCYSPGVTSVRGGEFSSWRCFPSFLFLSEDRMARLADRVESRRRERFLKGLWSETVEWLGWTSR